MICNVLRWIFVFFTCILYPYFLLAQSNGISIDSLRKTEMTLKVLTDSMTKGVNDYNRQAALSTFNPIFLDLIVNPETYDYPFDSLKTVSKLKSPDGKMRIYTWALQSRENGTYTYYGLVQYKDPKTSKIKLSGLVEQKYLTVYAESSELQPEGWYGALYYEIIEKKIKKNTYYFLLGWHGNDRQSTRKIIDVLFFDKWAKVCFGAPLFKNEKDHIIYRKIFEFNASVVMLLRYERKKKAIVFDHLSPSSPAFKGQYQHYGPDFTYDGFVFKKGIWKYRSNLDLRNPK